MSPFCWLASSATVFAIASMTSSASSVSTLSEPACPIPQLWSQEPVHVGEVGITPGRMKRWHDRPRHTLQRSEARSRGSVASTVGRVQRFGLDRSSSLPTVRTVIPLRRLPPRRSWFQSPVPRVKRRKRRNGFRQSGADWETAAACVKMETESSVLIRPLIATPAQGVSRS